MQPPKTAKPAPARREEPVSNVEQLGGRLDQSIITPNAAKPQAAYNRGEDDWSFFRRHPGAAVRNRLPFPNEFSADDLDEGGLDCFVHAIVKRGPDGRPMRRARWLLFVEGGNA